MKKQIKTTTTKKRQTIAKQKTKNSNKTKKRKVIIKQKKKQQKYFGENIYFEVILMIIFIPTSVLFLVPIFQSPLFKEECKQSQRVVYKSSNENSVKITTEKAIYNSGDKMTLLIKNNSDNSIYFEPCEYLDNFEKKVNGVWVDEKKVSGNRIYDSSSFRKGENITSCSVNLPRLSVGIYRAVIKVYYDCQMPGGDMCSSSETFYSNEFRVIGGENDFCDDKILENCNGKRVSVTGTFITSKAHFLSRIENRIVEHQWAGGIILNNSEKMKMKEGEKYKVIGIIRKGGQPCGLNNEQCMLDERGVVLPYPTSIKIEKIYPVE